MSARELVALGIERGWIRVAEPVAAAVAAAVARRGRPRRATWAAPTKHAAYMREWRRRNPGPVRAG